MRLWTLHPGLLDSKGLVAAWREGLLAQKVLEGQTKGYRNHPQLQRFRVAGEAGALMGRFLLEIADEAKRRGYVFDRTKIHGLETACEERMAVTRGQIEYEFELLKWKLEGRDGEKLAKIRGERDIRISGVFVRTEGGIASWEKASGEILGRLEAGGRSKGNIAIG